MLAALSFKADRHKAPFGRLSLRLNPTLGRESMNRLVAVFLSIGLTACFSLETRNWGEWTEKDLPQQSTGLLAGFDWHDWPGMIVRIDQHQEVATGYKSARLRPGMHIIEYSNHVHDFGHVVGEIKITLLAGHDYGFRFKTCYWCNPRRFAVWVDDLTTAELAWGSRPNWPNWYL